MENANNELIELLSADDADARTLALNWLSEGYVADPALTASVFSAWDKWGAETAFPDFPMLSYLPISEDQIEECCRRAVEMVKGGPLTAPTTRCAGKLIEQVSKLPASALQPHLELLQATVAKSKIFFRVDLPAIEHRISLLGMPADALAAKLDESIAALGDDLKDATAGHTGLHALEALRRQYPDYMNLPGVLANTPPSDGPQAISFQLTLQSLSQLEQAGLEPHLTKHLLDQRESVFVPVIDALVRIATPDAAHAMLQAYAAAPASNQQWIARGLQRIRVTGLAEPLAALRATVTEPHLVVMLLVAEIRQMDPASRERIASELGHLSLHSYALINALLIYTRLVDDEHLTLVRPAFADHLKRTDAALRLDLQEKEKKLDVLERRSREKARQRTLRRHREGNGKG
jgi:hypothetical protein